MLNRCGLEGTRMEDIADALGRTPGSIYHHVKSKEELTYRCYVRSCELRRTQLEAAADTALPGIQQAIDFINRFFEDSAESAILAELGSLREEWSAHVRKLQHDNVKMCQQIIRTGIADGSIADLDPELTGIALMSILEWIPFWMTSYHRNRITTIREDYTDIIVNGVSAKRIYSTDIETPVSFAIQRKKPDPFNKRELADQKLDRFLSAALAAFNRYGVRATSIDDISKKLNVSKGAFYYYFDSKEELLYRCYERAIAYIEENKMYLGKAEKELSHHDWEILTRRALFLRHQTDDGPFPAYHNLPYLNSEHRSSLNQGLRRVVKADRARVKDAIARKEFRKVEPLAAEKIRAGLVNWYPVWYSPDGPNSSQQIADHHSYIFLNGLSA